MLWAPRLSWVPWVSGMGIQGSVIECFEHLVCFLRSDLDPSTVVGFEDSDWVLPVVECFE